MTYTRTMVDNTSHNVTSRKRKSRALKAKRDSAAEKGITLHEGMLIAVRKKEFSVYAWDERTGDYVPVMTGKLD